MCVAAARWAQIQLLEEYPRANLSVFAVWFNMMPADSRTRWPASLLPDPRVVHLWDEAKTVGRWYAPRSSSLRAEFSEGSEWSGGEVLWDAYFLYAADATWDDAPTGLVRWGRTIIAGRDPLKRDIERLFGTASPKQ